MQETSTKPYLLRALYEWCTDNGLTPHIAVRVDGRTRVPAAYVRDGEIVLNVSFQAVGKLTMGNELVEFEARFGGKLQKIEVPVENVLAIYASENGQGMAFPLEEPHAGRPETAGEATDIPGGAALAEDVEEIVPGNDGDHHPPPDGPKTGRPRLKVVK